MNNLELVVLALALSVDAGAVSFSHGLVFVKNRVKNSFLLAFFTGFFQFLMPVLGYLFAGMIYSYVKQISSYIAFLIFFVLGVKFIYDAIFDKDKKTQGLCCISLTCLLSLAIATSIDALAAGVNLCFLEANIIKSSVIIGLTTFFVSVFCFILGQFFKKFPSKCLEILSGLILIFLAIKGLIK